ncbi:putative biosynthesis monooxygenase [Anaeramoeba flamelloides]|uniref:Biosynthesis monooxygenase n=1 Tax=Anaeramoeba flamelloides TaxID=1746091 RepID=A0AAV8A0J0_9EUKA|nr:putative biosynthesis monooxygenase [Anaeramoeba flamelloides]
MTTFSPTETFLLRVNFTTTGKKATETIMTCLKSFTKRQLESCPGTLMYHFIVPFPKTKPNYFEFSELYANEPLFWEHLNTPELIQLNKDSFTVETTKISLFYSYGHLEPNVLLCTDYFQSKYPALRSGFVINPKVQWGEEDKPSPIMMKLFFTAQKDQNEEENQSVKIIEESFKELSKMVNNQVVTFYTTVPEEENSPLGYEMLEVCWNESSLMDHISSEKGIELWKKIIKTQPIGDVRFTVPAQKRDSLK